MVFPWLKHLGQEEELGQRFDPSIGGLEWIEELLEEWNRPETKI